MVPAVMPICGVQTGCVDPAATVTLWRPVKASLVKKKVPVRPPCVILQISMFAPVTDVASTVGVFVGVFVGVLVGVFVSVPVGVTVGVLVGVFVGVLVGVFVGVLVGVFVGVLVGVFVGGAVFVTFTVLVPVTMAGNVAVAVVPVTVKVTPVVVEVTVVPAATFVSVSVSTSPTRNGEANVAQLLFCPSVTVTFAAVSSGVVVSATLNVNVVPAGKPTAVLHT